MPSGYSRPLPPSTSRWSSILLPGLHLLSLMVYIHVLLHLMMRFSLTSGPPLLLPRSDHPSFDADKRGERMKEEVETGFRTYLVVFMNSSLMTLAFNGS